MDQREQILSKFDITIEMLLEYYTSRLRKSIYKSLLIDEKTSRKDLSLYGTDYTEQTKNLMIIKIKIVMYEEHWLISRIICVLV